MSVHRPGGSDAPVGQLKIVREASDLHRAMSLEVLVDGEVVAQLPFCGITATEKPHEPRKWTIDLFTHRVIEEVREDPAR